MKKIFGAIAALAMIVGLAACGTPANQGTTNPNQLVVGWKQVILHLTGHKMTTQTGE